ncbi:hypothetical protein GHT09_010107 [Marmota monax]|uniref:SET domain-containing protein n=1 Tax=Marmota monax TaxID=9995 RepID=A0A834PUQ1_MARMO|nr:hypothetical protein GHT09_010107 [Marmota monax]
MCPCSPTGCANLVLSWPPHPLCAQGPAPARVPGEEEQEAQTQGAQRPSKHPLGRGVLRTRPGICTLGMDTQHQWSGAWPPGAGGQGQSTHPFSALLLSLPHPGWHKSSEISEPRPQPHSRLAGPEHFPSETCSLKHSGTPWAPEGLWLGVNGKPCTDGPDSRAMHPSNTGPCHLRGWHFPNNSEARQAQAIRKDPRTYGGTSIIFKASDCGWKWAVQVDRPFPTSYSSQQSTWRTLSPPLLPSYVHDAAGSEALDPEPEAGTERAGEAGRLDSSAAAPVASRSGVGFKRQHQQHQKARPEQVSWECGESRALAATARHRECSDFKETDGFLTSRAMCRLQRALFLDAVASAYSHLGQPCWGDCRAETCSVRKEKGPPPPRSPGSAAGPSRAWLITTWLAEAGAHISEDLGSEKFCVDASQVGAGSWLKYVRVACSCDDQNLSMCQINEQVGPGCAQGLCPSELS